MLATTSGIDVGALKVVQNRLELRRHLRIYVDYVSRRSVKRTYRGNDLPEVDSSRLCKLMDAPSQWIPVVETAAARLALVDWQTRTDMHDRSGPLFPDNYVKANSDAISRYWEQPLLQCEQQLVDALMTSGQSEFFNAPFPCTLDRFYNFSYSYQRSPVEKLEYGKARTALLEVLAELAPNTWHSVSALVECMRRTQPQFLFDAQTSRQCDLAESVPGQRFNTRLNGGTGHSFEQREGRYIERFLECFPLVLGYLEVAYGPPLSPKDVTPTWGRLRAFRLHPTLRHVLRKTLPTPRVTIQPNFELHVESLLPPVGLVRSLAMLGEVVAEDTVCVLRLRRERVTEWGATHPPESLIPWLSGLTGRTLPGNVQTELEDWLAQSQQFTLYTHHGVLEGMVPALKLAGHGAIEVGAGVHVVEKPAELYAALEAEALVPTHVRHQDDGLVLAPPGTTTRFPKAKPQAAKASSRKTVTVKRELTVHLQIQDAEYRDQLLARLVELRCPVQRNGACLVYSGQHDKAVEQAMASLKSEYRVVEDKP